MTEKTLHWAVVLSLRRSADGVSFDSVKNALRVLVLSVRYERYSLCAPRGIVGALQRYSASDIISIGCRYMEYMYSKISYKQSELMDYVSKRLVDEGYIDANINQKLSDDELFKAIAKLEFQFKVEKLLTIRQNKEKFLYTNTIPAAENVKLSSNTRKIGHVTALDITIDAEPGEYAFILRKPEVDQHFKQMKDKSEDKDIQNFDISVLTEGAFFFTIK